MTSLPGSPAPARACTIPSGSPSPPTSRTRSSPCLPQHGRLLMTAAARSARARGSRRSPACWTCRPGRPGCGSSSAKERPHPGAQLRFTDIDGHRFTCLATSTKGGQLADLELRHRRRARCEDRIRCAKDTGLRNLPLHGFASRRTGPGPGTSPPRTHACTRSHPADQPEKRPYDHEETSRARGTPLTRRDSRAARRGQPLKTAASR